MSRILMETPTHLNHFSNIGYQTYYNPQESKDLLDKMFFESYRLGEITSYMEQVEPILRNTDLVSIDMAGVQAADIDMPQGYVNGFSAREICAISRYAGLSSQTAVLGLFNVPTSVRGRMLIGEVIWYFIEGVNYRIKEFPTIEDKNYTKHIVLLDDFTIEFYKSNRTGRWWILPSEASKEHLCCLVQKEITKKRWRELSHFAGGIFIKDLSANKLNNRQLSKIEELKVCSENCFFSCLFSSQ